MPRLPTSALRGFVSLMATLVMTACASAPPKPTVDFKHDYDFSQVTKITFYKNSGQVSGDNPLQLSDMQRNRIDAAVELALINKGFQFVEDASQADILLTWHLVTQHKTDVRTYQTASHGYYGGHGGYRGYNRYSMYNCWSCMPTQTEVSVKDYTEGTFIVDMIDPGMKQSVWRGKTQSRLKGKQEYDEERYNAAAAAMFAAFPPH